MVRPICQGVFSKCGTRLCSAGPWPQVAHGPGFQYVTEVSGPIEPYRAVPLLANSHTLNANGLATSAPRSWGNFRYFSRSQEQLGPGP
jgi:hypothetical protein